MATYGPKSAKLFPAWGRLREERHSRALSRLERFFQNSGCAIHEVCTGEPIELPDVLFPLNSGRNLSMTRLNGPFRASFAATVLGLSIPVLMTGCSTAMTFPTASVAPSYNESPIQLTAGEFRPVVFVAQVIDDRPSQVAGAVGSTTFTSGQELHRFIHQELEGQLSSGGVPLGRSKSEAESQSNSHREVSVRIRSVNYGAATSLLHKTVAGINLLVTVKDESGRPVFAQTYFGSSTPGRVWSTAERSGDLMSKAVQEAVTKALRDGNFRASVGL